MSGDLKNIDIDGLINDLISEEARMGANADLNANKASKGGRGNNRKYCQKCRVTGHITSTCWVLHPELKPNDSENPNKKPNKAKKAKESKGEQKTESSKAIMTVSKTNSPPNKHITARKPIRANKPKMQLEPSLLMSTFINTVVEDLSESDSNQSERDIANQAFRTVYNYRLVLDSGASEHYTPNKGWLLNYKPTL